MLAIPHLKATGGRDRFAFPPLPDAAGLRRQTTGSGDT